MMINRADITIRIKYEVAHGLSISVLSLDLGLF